jgi:hypothetical protein
MAEGTLISGLIQTPAGPFQPSTNDLVEALKEAARYAGLVELKAYINGEAVKSWDDPLVKGKTVSDISDIPRVEGVEPLVVDRYDKAGS